MIVESINIFIIPPYQRYRQDQTSSTEHSAEQHWGVAVDIHPLAELVDHSSRTLACALIHCAGREVADVRKLTVDVGVALKQVNITGVLVIC